jgi:hypothetical protein
MDEAVRKYLSEIGKKGGSVKGSCKARKLSREHYAKVSAGQRERWRLWHIDRERERLVAKTAV